MLPTTTRYARAAPTLTGPSRTTAQLRLGRVAAHRVLCAHLALISPPQGLSESRVASHNSHFGARSLNKMDFSIFPFTWKSVKTITDKHGVKYPED